MSLKADLWTYITSNLDVQEAIGDRLYPTFAPSDAARPFVIYERTSCDPVHHMGTPSADSYHLTKDTFSFTVFAETEASCDEVKNIFHEVLNGIEAKMGETSVRRIFVSAESDGMEFPTDGENDSDYKDNIDFAIWYFRNPAAAGSPAILTEEGMYLLLETGDKILLEAS